MGEFSDKPYLTRAERAKFKRLREAGAVSFFRLDACEECRGEVPKGKQYCSWDCYTKAEDEDGDQDQDDSWEVD